MSRLVAGLTSSQRMMWSPALSRWMTAPVAATPDEKASPCFAFSSEAMFFWNAVRVGLAPRE